MGTDQSCLEFACRVERVGQDDAHCSALGMFDLKTEQVKDAAVREIRGYLDTLDGDRATVKTVMTTAAEPLVSTLEALHALTDALPKHPPLTEARQLAHNSANGEYAERQAGIDPHQPKVRIDSLTDTADYRIPDYFDKNEGVLREVKNVQYLNYTNQLQDFVLYCQQNNVKMELIVDVDTIISPELQQVIDSSGKSITVREIDFT